MRKNRGRRQPRSYPAHVYRTRRSLLIRFGLLAAVMTALGAAMFSTGEPHGATVWLLSLPVWAFIWLSHGKKDGLYFRVDRDGIELGTGLGERRFDWFEIDDVWMSTFQGRDVFVIRLLHADSPNVMIDDLWDSPVESVFEHVVRYRKRYGGERLSQSEPSRSCP